MRGCQPGISGNDGLRSVGRLTPQEQTQKSAQASPPEFTKHSHRESRVTPATPAGRTFLPDEGSRLAATTIRKTKKRVTRVARPPSPIKQWKKCQDRKLNSTQRRAIFCATDVLNIHTSQTKDNALQNHQNVCKNRNEKEIPNLRKSDVRAFSLLSSSYTKQSYPAAPKIDVRMKNVLSGNTSRHSPFFSRFVRFFLSERAFYLIQGEFSGSVTRSPSPY